MSLHSYSEDGTTGKIVQYFNAEGYLDGPMTVHPNPPPPIAAETQMRLTTHLMQPHMMHPHITSPHFHLGKAASPFDLKNGAAYAATAYAAGPNGSPWIYGVNPYASYSYAIPRNVQANFHPELSLQSTRHTSSQNLEQKPSETGDLSDLLGPSRVRGLANSFLRRSDLAGWRTRSLFPTRKIGWQNNSLFFLPILKLRG